MNATIWDKWTNESAKTVYEMGYDEILESVIGLWNDFTTDETGKTYVEYIGRTPQNTAKQIMDEVQKEVRGETE